MKGQKPPPRSWEDWREYRATKKPPPEHGIKVKKLGATWWGQRWIEALEHVLGADSGRLSRGRSYARAGRTHDLSVKDGKVSARVTGTRPAPYEVSIQLAQLPDAVWQLAIQGMAEQARFSAELLAGEMPKAIDDMFHAAGSSLFPEQRADLTTDCSCPDWGDPCKHVAAAHYVLGEALDQDPFLLFELRGRTRAQVLGALRQARTRAAALPAAAQPAPEPPRPEDYERAPADLPLLQFSFEPPGNHAAVLRQLGVPVAWKGASSPAEVLAPLVQKAAEAARRLALAEESPPAAPEPARAPRTRPARKARSSQKRSGPRAGRAR
jgi:uncharacterized Zn finger protein